MGWKNWPYWLKGGMITSIISLVISLVYPFALSSSKFERFLPMPLGVLSIFILLIPSKIHFGLLKSRDVISFFIIIFLFYFLIGAIIGFIIGKIKSKNKK